MSTLSLSRDLTTADVGQGAWKITAGASAIDIEYAIGASLATLTLVAPLAGQPTQTFGWIFRKGDIPAGTAPVFYYDGLFPQPYSAGLQTYWSDGSLAYASFMLLPNISATSATLMIAAGGTWPVGSERTLGELYQQGLTVNGPPMPGVAYTRPAPVSAWLNGDVNTYGAVKWLDGAAGAGWRISTHMAMTEGGPKDGMLVVDHYVLALNNGSGALGGYRWMGAIRQPFCNQSGQANNAPGSFVMFAPPNYTDPAAGLSWQVGDQPPTPVTWEGNDGNPLTPQSFTYDSTTGALQTASPNNYYMGASDNQTLPVVITGTSLPPLSNGSNTAATVANNSFAFLMTNGANPQQFTLHWTGICGGFDQAYFSASGSGTVTPVPGLWPFNRLIIAAPDGKMNFFRSSGSLAADTTARVQIDQQYWQSTGLVPPFNLSVTGAAFGGVINETPWPYSWFPYSIGPMTQYQPGVGDHPDIGILPWVCVQEFYNQTVNGENIIRAVGLSSGMALPDFKDAATDRNLNLGNAADNYGLPLGVPGMNWSPAYVDSYGGFTPPNGGATAIGYALSLTEHEPCYPVWAYLRTGELIYLDFIVAQAQGALLCNGNRAFTPAVGGTTKAYYAAANASQSEMRTMAWACRDMQWAALLYPRDPSAKPENPVYSDGTNIAQYLTDAADDTANWPWDQFQNCPSITTNPWAVATGNWLPCFTNYNSQGGKPAFGLNCPEWEFGDFCSAMCLAVARGNANAKQFIQSCVAGAWNNFAAALGLWGIYTDDRRAIYPLGAEDSSGNFASALITSNNVLMMGNGGNEFSAVQGAGFNGTWVTWQPNTSGGPAFTVQGITDTNNQIKNGDLIMPSFEPNGPAFYPAALMLDTVYYVVGWTANATTGGGTFDLSLTPGGAPVPITDSTPNEYPWRFNFRYRNSTPPATGNIYNNLLFGLIMRAGMCWANALGIPGFGPLLDDINYRLANTAGTGINPAGWDYVSGGQGPVDPRYLYQPTFGVANG